MSETFAGQLLIATPQLIDPNFYRTVVLVLQDDDEGTVGVVLNRPMGEPVGDHLPDWRDATEDGEVHAGGPVEPEVAIGLAVGGKGEATAVPGLSMVDLNEPPAGPLGSVRIYSGYAGWGPQQLEDEITMGSWYVAQASPDDPFAHAETLWREVLRRQSGQVSVVSTYSDQPELN